MDIVLKKKNVVLQTCYNRYHGKKEEVFGKSRVEPGDSLPLKVQIDRMMQAGVMLNASRAIYYEFKPEEVVPDGYLDVTRTQGFDRADASKLVSELGSRVVKTVEKQRKEKDDKVNLESKDKVPDGKDV